MKSKNFKNKLKVQYLFIYKKTVKLKVKIEKISHYIVKTVLLLYPKNDPVLIYLKQFPDKHDEFVNVLFTQIASFNFKKFSISTENQEALKNAMISIVEKWMKSIRISNVSHKFFLRSTSYSGGIDSKDTNQEDFKFTITHEIFIDNFCKQLDELYCQFKALDLKTVKRLNGNEDKAAQVVQTYQAGFPTINLGPVGLPLGPLALLATQLAVHLKDISIERAAKRMGDLFQGQTMIKRAKIIEFAAQSIAYRYQHQIENFTHESAKDFGVSAAYRAVEYITRNDESLIADKAGFLAKLTVNIFNYVTGTKGAPQLVDTLEDPAKILMAGILEGVSECKETPLSTKDNRRLLPSAIFRNTGLIVRDDQQQLCLYTHPDLTKNKDKNSSLFGTPLYGYCYGTLEEALAGSYVEDKTTLLSMVIPDEKAVIVTAPKLSKSELRTELLWVSSWSSKQCLLRNII